jgi:hypothetical protein
MAQAGKTRKFTALSSKLHRRRVRAGLRTLALQRDVWKILKRRGAGLQPMAETLKRLGTPLFPLTRRGTALATTAVLAALAVTFALLKPLAMNEGGPDGPQAPPASASTAEPGSRDAAETMLLQSIEASANSILKRAMRRARRQPSNESSNWPNGGARFAFWKLSPLSANSTRPATIKSRRRKCSSASSNSPSERT